MYRGFGFGVTGKAEGNGRVGVLSTPHGKIKTPMFMPVGTQATVKSLTPEDLKNTGASIILSNTYHLYLRPGAGVVSEMGGLHNFMKWDRAILTDSGGFQAQSLSKNGGETDEEDEKESPMAKVMEEGVEFRSHLDGSKHFFTPELSIEVQELLGADIIMAFDECTPNTDREYAKSAMERTHRWLIRSKKKWEEMEAGKEVPQALFGIIQGGKFEDLRWESAKFVVDQDLPGIAIGGESIGSDPNETAETISWVRDLLPKDKPLYAMGVGVRPSDLVSVVAAGADMFDCVAPTRLARTGLLYHPEHENERINIAKAEFSHDKRILNEECDCYTCKEGFSRAYLSHLFRARELLFYRLASIHNLRTMIRTVEEIQSVG